MNVALVVLWGLVVLVGVGLIIIGVRLRRTDEIREGVSGNAVAFVGVLLVAGGAIALQPELAR